MVCVSLPIHGNTFVLFPVASPYMLHVCPLVHCLPQWYTFPVWSMSQCLCVTRVKGDNSFHPFCLSQMPQMSLPFPMLADGQSSCYVAEVISRKWEDKSLGRSKSLKCLTMSNCSQETFVYFIFSGPKQKNHSSSNTAS